MKAFVIEVDQNIGNLLPTKGTVMKKAGALPDHLIKQLMDSKSVMCAQETNINPASLDLTLSPEIYRVDGIVQPRATESVRDILTEIGAERFDFHMPLERDVAYLCRLNERFSLDDIYGYANPKSSSGRNDVHVRVMADGVFEFDSIPNGDPREAWLLIISKSFPIRLALGMKLTQVRFFDEDTRFSKTEELALAMDAPGAELLFRNDGTPIRHRDLEVFDKDGSIILTIDLEKPDCGWECLGSTRSLDFSKRKEYAPEDFFRKIEKKNGKAVLHRGGFYVLRTKEWVRVPPWLACEMSPMDARAGEFRSHYAGFIDPGWGWGKEGEGRGRRLVLEIRPFEDLVFRDGQPVARIKFERLIDEPKVLYDSSEKSHYTDEPVAPRLGKQFRQ